MDANIHNTITNFIWGIADDVLREVLPYTPDAWVDASKTQIGYDFFTRHFYKPAPMRSLKEIRNEVFALEQETEGLLEEIAGGEA